MFLHNLLGGHRTLPKEQKTQQSPSFGFKLSLQFEQV
jgi:hypothetical protein